MKLLKDPLIWCPLLRVALKHCNVTSNVGNDDRYLCGKKFLQFNTLPTSHFRCK